MKNKPVIAAVNRCAAQRQRQSRVFQQTVKPCLPEGSPYPKPSPSPPLPLPNPDLFEELPGRDILGVLAADVDHGSRGGDESWLADVVAFLFFGDYLQNELHEFLVGCAAAHSFVQVVIPYGK
jgi:hypothetical protein